MLRIHFFCLKSEYYPVLFSGAPPKLCYHGYLKLPSHVASFCRKEATDDSLGLGLGSTTWSAALVVDDDEEEAHSLGLTTCGSSKITMQKYIN